MSVSQGQQANASTFNNAFVSKTTDSTTTAQITLDHAGSGGTITDAQQQINDNDALSTANQSNLSTHISTTTGVHGTTGAVVGTTGTQTLTNKSIDADSNTITNIDNDEVKASAGINWSKLEVGSTTNRILQTNTSTGVIEENSDTPASGEFLKYDGTNYVWDTPAGGGSFDFYNRIENYNFETDTT